MTVSVVLLSSNNVYVGDNGELPERPSFDKLLITALAKDRLVLCSRATLNTLPPSIIQAAAGLTTDHRDPWDVNFGIETFNALSDVFIIVRSAKVLKGKEFKLERLYQNYNLIYKNNELELWMILNKV